MLFVESRYTGLSVVLRPVLVVDDDTVSRHVLVQALASGGSRHTSRSRSGAEALAADRQGPAVARPARPRDAAARTATRSCASCARAPRRAISPSSSSPALDADDEIAKRVRGGRRRLRAEAVQAGRARRAHPRPAAPSRRDGRARAEGEGRAGRPRAHAGARVEPRLPRHPLHRRPAHRRGGARSTACRSSSCASRGSRLRRRRVRRRAAPRSAHRPHASTPRSSRCSRAASRSSSPTRRRTRSSRSSATTRRRARRSARSRSSPSSTRGGRWACSSSAPKQTFAFGEHELALCRTVSNAMAIALRNARVLQSLRDQTQQVTVARFEAERRLQTAPALRRLLRERRRRHRRHRPRGAPPLLQPEGARDHRLRRGGAPRPRRSASVFARRRAERLARAPRRGSRKAVYPQGVDIRVKRKDGASSPSACNFNSVLREEGAVLCSFRDVTAERAVEAELVKTKDFLQRVIDSSVDAIISADMHGRVLLFNRAAERIYGKIRAGDARGERARALPRRASRSRSCG